MWEVVEKYWEEQLKLESQLDALGTAWWELKKVSSPRVLRVITELELVGTAVLQNPDTNGASSQILY